MNEYSNALIWHKKALEFGNNNKEKAEAYDNCAIDSYLMGEMIEAIKYSFNAVLIAPDDAEYVGNLGAFHFKLKKYEEGEKYLLRSIKMNPNIAVFNGYYANLLYDTNRYNESIRYFEKLYLNKKDVSERLNPGMVLKWLFLYSNVLNMQQNYKKSMDICQEIVQRDEFAMIEYKDEIYFLMCKNSKQLNRVNVAIEYGLKAIKISDNEEYQQFMEKIENVSDQ